MYVQEERSIEAYIVDGLEMIFAKLGRPPGDYTSNSFWIMIDEIVKIWRKYFPQELADYTHDRELDLTVERSLSASVKGGFKASVSFPPTMFQLIKAYFPDLIVHDKKFIGKFLARYPFFNRSNYT